jgi:hypothetical protein
LNADNQQSEDEVSNPDEDAVAGQVAVMCGAVKKWSEEDDESDEESSTDDILTIAVVISDSDGINFVQVGSSLIPSVCKWFRLETAFRSNSGQAIMKSRLP